MTIGSLAESVSSMPRFHSSIAHEDVNVYNKRAEPLELNIWKTSRYHVTDVILHYDVGHLHTQLIDVCILMLALHTHIRQRHNIRPNRTTCRLRL